MFLEFRRNDENEAQAFCLFFFFGKQAALIDRSKGKGSDDDDEDDDGGGQEGSEAAYTLTQGTLEKHLRLDSAAASAVMLLPDPSNPHQYGSLYNVLNRCVRTPRLRALPPPPAVVKKHI